MYRLYVIYISLCTTCTYNIMHVILWSILLFTIFICYIKLGSLVEDFFSCVICIRTTGSYVTHEINHFVYFYLDQKAVSLIKSGWQRRWQQNGWDSDLCQWNLPTQICYSNPVDKDGDWQWMRFWFMWMKSANKNTKLWTLLCLVYQISPC